MRWLIKSGDVVMDNRDNSTWIACSDENTQRYLDDADREMIAHGMGEYAGTYESVVKVVNSATGEELTRRTSNWHKHISNLTAKDEETTKNAMREANKELAKSACTTL
jgi:hypothetical protein